MQHLSLLKIVNSLTEHRGN